MHIWRIVLFSALLFAVFGSGYNFGQNSVQVKFDKYIKTSREESDKRSREYRLLELKHKENETSLLKELIDKRDIYEEALRNTNDEFNARLLKQSERTDFYRRQAANSGCTESDLADHTARLDLSIQEGRRLVKQLTTTLRLREDELRTLGKIINNDRNTLNGKNGKN